MLLNCSSTSIDLVFCNDRLILGELASPSGKGGSSIDSRIKPNLVKNVATRWRCELPRPWHNSVVDLIFIDPTRLL
jgi:hypothetical protein